jgi:Niemann-Pick C1 protein
VILSVITLTGYSVSQLLLLRQDFSYSWFVPRESHFHQYLTADLTEFPDKSENSHVVIGRIDYASEMNKILELSERMNQRTDILYDVQSWAHPFEVFVHRNYRRPSTTLNATEFLLLLTQFLYSSDGGKYRPNFKFDGQLKCGEPAPKIKMATIDFKFRKFDGRDEYLPAKAAIEQLVENAHFQTGEAFATVWSQSFIFWLANEIVDTEIIRNLLLALLAVMLCTVPLIRNLNTCFWIFVCVLLTLVNIGGFMHRLGLSLDVVTCVGLQLTAGLCVDYAAHIGHCFLTIRTGSREERAKQTMQRIGPAVFSGGVSTLLAFSALATVDAYAYTAVFKVRGGLMKDRC